MPQQGIYVADVLKLAGFQVFWKNRLNKETNFLVFFMTPTKLRTALFEQYKSGVDFQTPILDDFLAYIILTLDLNILGPA